MKRFVLIATAIGVSLAGCAASVSSRHSGSPDNVPTIHVDTESRLVLPADEFAVTFTIQETGESPEHAVQAGAKTQEAACELLRESDVNPETVRPVSYTVGPNLEWEDDDLVQRGFEARSEFELIVEDHALLSGIVIALSKAVVKGEINVEARIANAIDARRKVIRLAVTKAQSDAMIVADTLGVRLGMINDVRIDFVRDGAGNAGVSSADFQFEERDSEMNVAVTDTVEVSAGVTCWFLIEQ